LVIFTQRDLMPVPVIAYAYAQLGSAFISITYTHIAL